MVKQLLVVLLSVSACFGQALYTFRDPAFMAAVAPLQAAFSPSTNAGMVAYWKLNESSTNLLVYDSSGLGHTGVLHFETTFVQNTNSDYTGLTNIQNTNVLYGYYYNGYVECGGTPGLDVSAANGDFSLSQWVMWDQNNATLQLLGESFGYDDNSGVDPVRWELIKPPVQGMQWNLSKSTNSISLSGQGGIPTTWKHVVLSKRGTNYSMYVNGSLYASTNFSTALTSVATPVLRIGGSPSYLSRGWRGWIGETILWKGYGLSASDAYDLYHSYYGVLYGVTNAYPNITNNLIVYLPMSKGSGTVLQNATTNGTDGWIQPPASWTDKGHNHKYAVNFGQGGYVSTADLLGYDFITNVNWSVGMWLCHTGSGGSTETLFYKNTSSGFPNIIPNPQIQRLTPGGGSDVLQYYSRATDWRPWNFSMVDNKWTFLVITKAGGLHTWYLCNDGTINATTSSFGEGDDPYPTPPYGHAQYEIGNGGAPWQGYIEEFRIHRNYCLSSNEVWYLYNRYYSP